MRFSVEMFTFATSKIDSRVIRLSKHSAPGVKAGRGVMSDAASFIAPEMKLPRHG